MTPAAPRPSLLGRIIQAITPRAQPPRDAWAAGVAHARRNFAAAQVSRLTQGWSVLNTSANSDIFRSLDALRARSRVLAQNDEYVKKWLGMVVTNVVGPTGFRFQARVYDQPNKPDKLANDAIEAAWERWGKKGVADITGRNTLARLCQLAVQACARDGEFLIQIVRGTAAANPFGLALRLLDVNRLDTQLNRPESDGVNLIRMGVELNNYGRPVAYHLRTRNPGDVYNVAGQNLSTHIRLLAQDVIHEFMADDGEQVRGVPWSHAAMIRLNNRGGYEEAAIIAARVGASKMGFFTTPDGQGEVLATGTIPDASDPGDQPLAMDADAGTFQSLPEGVSFTPFNPDYPTAMFGDFIKANLRGTASGLGVAYHTLANDLEGVSFSSIRSGTLEERDSWTLIQEWFSSALLERLYAEFLDAALSFSQLTMPNGSALPLAKRDKFTPHKFQGRRWEWVDPLKDIEADITAINNGLKSPQAVADKLGLDYEDLLQEIKTAQDMREAIGVVIVAPKAAPAAMAPADPPDPASAASKAMAAQIAELRSAVAVLLTREAPAVSAPAMELHVHQAGNTINVEPARVEFKAPEQGVTNIIQVEPTPVQVTNHVTVAPTPVEVSANFEAVIQPAEVRLELDLPERKTVGTVERDAKGNIVKTTQIETNL